MVASRNNLRCSLGLSFQSADVRLQKGAKKISERSTLASFLIACVLLKLQ